MSRFDLYHDNRLFPQFPRDMTKEPWDEAPLSAIDTEEVSRHQILPPDTVTAHLARPGAWREAHGFVPASL